MSNSGSAEIGLISGESRVSKMPSKTYMDSEPILRLNNIEKSQQDNRDYRGLQLQNGIKVLLVSDTKTDVSAAALAVQVGHMSDPDNLPGLAHFCEHMLFLGTEKYPHENGYTTYLSQSGGSSNAATYPLMTKYHFYVAPDKLDEALDRFSQFFIGPLFTPSATEREIHAVNSEHEKNLSSDVWRIKQVQRHLAKPGHAYKKFGSGNKTTLYEIPKQRNIEVRDELLKFHKQWYSSNIMSLAVIGKETLDELEKLVMEKFSEIENKNVEIPHWPREPYDIDQYGQKIVIVPVKDLRSLTISFTTDDLTQFYKSAPDSYLSHLLGHEGNGSILSELRRLGWCNNLLAGHQNTLNGFGFFEISIDLTQEGIDHVDDIIEIVFQYLTMLRERGPQKWIFEECVKINEMRFRFKEEEKPERLVTGVVSCMQVYPLEQVLTAPYLNNEWRPDLITKLLDELIPSKCRVIVVGQNYEKEANLIEPYYQTKYGTCKIDKNVIKKWENCKLNENLDMPLPNAFIPENFELAPFDTDLSKHPIIIMDTDILRVWHKQDNFYLKPKACMSFDMLNPIAYLDPLYCNLNCLMVSLIKDQLNEYIYDADLADLKLQVAPRSNGIDLKITGYNDKQVELLKKLLDHLFDFNVDEKRFDILKDEYKRSLKNFSAEQPYQHSMYYLALLLTENVWAYSELLDAMELVTFDRVLHYAKEFFSRLHTECFLYGNITKQQALEISGLVNKRLEGTNAMILPLLARQMLGKREYKLCAGDSYLFEKDNIYHKSSCAHLYFQCGLQTDRSNIMVNLIAQILTEPCYDCLRTKEQLGYIVFSGMRKVNGANGIRIIVQSSKQPSYVEGRIETFLDNFLVTQVLMSDKKLPPKKRTVSQTVKNSTHLSESNASYEKEGTNKKKLTNAPNTTTKNAKPDVKGRLDQNKIARNPQAKKVVSRNSSTAFKENHVSLRAKQVSKPTIVLKTTGQKPTTSQKPLNSLKDKKNIIQKKNAVLDSPHNVTVTSPPSKRKNDPNEIASNSDRKADTFKLIRKGSRTLAPDEIVVLKRESAKMRSEEAIQKENTQTDQTLTTNIKEPVAFEVKFDDKDKKEKTICNEKTPSLAGRQKSDEELNYSDDFESYESDFETGSSTSTLSTPSTSSDINRKLSDEEANQEDSHCQITSDEGEQDDDTDVPQKSLFDLPTDKERKLDSGNYDTSSRKINAYRPSELAVQSSQPQTGSWETTSLGISEQMDSGISTCATIMSCSHNKRNIEVIFGGYRYFYMKPIISSRGCELKTKIQFDVLSFTLIELKPISYEIFMQTFGKMNTNQNFTQTQDNQMNVEQQTEIYETRSVWTQHPPQFVLEISESCDKNGKYNQLSCGEDFDKNEEQLMPYCELEQNLNAMKWLNTQNYKRENELNRNRQRMPINYQNLNSFLLRSSLLIDQILGSSKTNTKTNPIANDAFKNDQVLQRVCEKSFYMETNFLNTLRVVKIFSNNKFNLLITVHESLPDTNVYSSDFSNLLMVWCTNTCDKPLRLLTTWSEVSKVEIPNDSSDIVIAALRDGSIAMWDLRETHSFCSKLDGYLTHFAATQSIVPTYSADNGSKELESDLGACLDVKSFKSPTNNILMQTTFPKIQFVSLHDSGIVTVWTLVQTSEITFNLAQVAQTIQVFDSISPWARVKLMQSSIINIKEFLEMKSIHSRSRFDKTMDFFQKNIYCDESLRELNENIAEVGRDGIRFTSLECGSENIFICTNRNFILMCSKTLKIDRLKKIFIDDSQFLFPTALKILNNDRYLAVGLSNGVVMILNCQSDRVTKSNKEQMKKSELSKHIVTDRDPTLNNSLTSKSCAIQNILLNVQKSCEQMDSSQDYRPSTAACMTLIDSKRKPFELRIIDQQVIMSGSALRKNLIQLLELSSDGWYLFALANGHVRIYDFYLEQELPSEESPEPGKIIDLATGKCGCKENNLMILRPKTEVEVIILKQ